MILALLGPCSTIWTTGKLCISINILSALEIWWIGRLYAQSIKLWCAFIMLTQGWHLDPVSKHSSSRSVLEGECYTHTHRHRHRHTSVCLSLLLSSFRIVRRLFIVQQSLCCGTCRKAIRQHSHLMYVIWILKHQKQHNIIKCLLFTCFLPRISLNQNTLICLNGHWKNTLFACRTVNSS